ncbi:hypothetical protein [uncultured Parasphingopyxis sp.]|uniref:hypothetical protein n=1 Tax=uncultured Parasphingopyxis sp. TaxID=1547918 RepID=UPI00260E5D4B|nr:hypothetical protein [uncultured Parasphingopyxis sp.]
MHKKILGFTMGTALAVLATATAAQAQQTTPLTAGQERSAQLTTDSAIMNENVYYLDNYRISGEAGQRIAITMMSDDFDTLLEVGEMSDGMFSQLAMDDDGAGELNSRLVFTFPDDGEYIVRARTFGAGSTGNYTISAEMLPPPPPPPPPTPISVGQTVDGSFGADSPAYETPYGGDPRYYALYSLEGTPGQTVTITLRSEDFDAYLEAGGMTPLGFAVAESNDDGVGSDGEMIGLDSRLTLTFSQAGTLIIRPTTLGGGATGAWTLTVE